MLTFRRPDPKIERLRALPPFHGANERDLRDIAAAGDLVAVEAGRVLCRTNRRAVEAYVVVDGMVDVVRHGTTLATLRRGQIVGELGVLDGEPRSADVVAATDVTVLVIPAQELRALFETNHTVRGAVMRQLAERVRRADEELTAGALAS